MNVPGFLFVVLSSVPVWAQPAKRVQLLCHRTANKDAPENTMESLQQAVLLGCDGIEIDVRRTLDGVLVLNHDGFTERLTDGSGEVEQSMYGDLRHREAGAWMGARWDGLRMARLDEALLYAKQQHVQLILDIKTKGIGRQVLRAVDDLDMRSSVQYGGERADILALLPHADDGLEQTWLQPGATAEQIAALHAAGKRVIVNFSANTHEMDLAAMQQAVARGADGINVDYPRLGADAVGRPVEAVIAALSARASEGKIRDRVEAIARLAEFRGFPLQASFAGWLMDPDEGVSRAAAVALVDQRPRPHASVFLPALHAASPAPRAGAAWGLGQLHAETSLVVPLLRDADPSVNAQALFALARMPGPVPAGAILPLLQHADPLVRGAAAVALAAKDPVSAARVLPGRFRLEIRETLRLYNAWAAQGKPGLSPVETKRITDRYRCEMKFLQAISSLHGDVPVPVLEEQAFDFGDDFTQTHALVAAFQMWDRIGARPADAVSHLGDPNAAVADRAEWMLTMADARVESAVRQALSSDNPAVRERAIRICAFRGDRAAIPLLQKMPQEPAAAWAATKIRLLTAGR